MQRWLSILLLQLSALISLAQNREVVTARGFNNTVPQVDTLPGHQWVFAGVSNPAQGAIYLDTISIWVCDSVGQILQRMTSVPPVINENYVIDHLIGLPDSTIILQYSGGDCDACCYTHVLEKWKKDGTLVWQKVLPDESYPSIYSATSDNKLFSQDGYNVSQLDLSSGEILWQYQYSSEYHNGAIFIPNTADFILYDGESLKYYEMDTTGILKYNLKATRPFAHMLYNYCAGKNGMIYARYGVQYPFLVKFSTNLSTLEEYPLNEYPNKLTPLSDGVLILIHNGPNYKLIFFDSLGYSSLIYENINREISGWEIKAGFKGFAVTGNYEAGTHITSDAISHQGWFRYFPIDSLQQHGILFSVSITSISQRTPVNIDSTFYNVPGYIGYLRHFEGGNFEIMIKNTGDQAIDSFWINTRFSDAWFVGWCGLEMCKNVFFHQHLDPGESAWVEFGDISAIQQFEVPDQFCFWTSGPNARPDDYSGDDSKCVDRIVNTYDLTESSMSINPQPASDEIIISNVSVRNQDLIATIYSLEGIICKTELLDRSQDHFYLSVAELPNGFYILKINQQIQLLVVAHRE